MSLKIAHSEMAVKEIFEVCEYFTQLKYNPPYFTPEGDVKINLKISLARFAGGWLFCESCYCG
jgi:hypothetical protein